MRWRFRVSWACASVVPTGAVTSFSCVMTSETRRSRRSSKRRSRFVRMPTRRPASVMGTPEMWKRAMMACASPSVAVGGSVTGSTIIPLSERFTRSTWLHCSGIERFLWRTPMPPSRASAIANSASVTVSIAALTTGMLRVIPRLKRLRTSASRG